MINRVLLSKRFFSSTKPNVTQSANLHTNSIPVKKNIAVASVLSAFVGTVYWYTSTQVVVPSELGEEFDFSILDESKTNEMKTQ